MHYFAVSEMKLESTSYLEGKSLSFRDFYDELAPRMLFYVFRMTQNRQVSEDIIHETFVFYWENQGKFDSVLDTKAYLFSVLRNLVRNYMRLEANRKRILATLELPENEADDYLMMTAEICGQIRHVVNQLPAQTKTIIELSIAGMSVGNIAEQLNISVNTVKTLKKRGYQSLREKLGYLRLLIDLLLIS